jgi:hypothetical protein
MLNMGQARMAKFVLCFQKPGAWRLTLPPHYEVHIVPCRAADQPPLTKVLGILVTSKLPGL